MKADYIKFQNRLDIPNMETHIQYVMVSLHADLMDKIAEQYFGRKPTQEETCEFKIKDMPGKRFILYGDKCLGEIEFVTTYENDKWQMGYKFIPLI